MAEICLRRRRLLQDELETFFHDLQDGFLEGNLTALASRFGTLLVVYSVSGVVVLYTAEDIVKRMQMYREALLALTARAGRFELVSEDPLVNNRLRVTVRAIYTGHDGKDVTNSLARYFLVRQGDELVVEMIEYLEPAIPSGETDQNIFH